MSNEISLIFGNISKILLVIGLFCIFWKLFNKKKYPQISAKKIFVIYKLHTVAFKLSTVFAIIHCFTLISQNPTQMISGWILTILMIIMDILGVWLSFKNNRQPFDAKKDLEFTNIRIIKWFLTLLLFIALITHFFIK